MEERLKIILLIFTIIHCFTTIGGQDSSCRWNDYNFEPLDNLQWDVIMHNGTSRVDYQISLCRPLNSSITGCGQNTSVCQVNGINGLSIGAFRNTFGSSMTEDSTQRELTLALEGGSECQDRGTSQKTKTYIIFKCGKTLGVPEFVNSYACNTYFEWHSTVACKSPGNVSETKCYVYDNNGQIRDLTPLTKTSGSYQVETDADDADGDLYINVCRDITQLGQCQNSAACLVRNSSSSSLGSVNSNSRLQFNSDGCLSVTYTSSVSQTGCSSLPSTKITFRCPRRGMGGLPRLVSSQECQYFVEWETEFACPVADLVSDTCQLNQPQNNIAIDLRSLATDREHAFSVKVQGSGGSTYTYSLNLCSLNTTSQGVMCGVDRFSAACQFEGQASPRSLGQLKKQTLRYTDRQLSLTYEGGDPCSSGFQRKTVVNFHCDETAGRGVPEFSAEDSCTYIFDWKTDLACVAALFSCQISARGAKYDLSRLTRADGMANWHVSETENSDQIILNICDDLSSSDNLATGCPPGAAICLIKSGVAGKISLGKFKSSPTFDLETGSIRVAYTDGDSCGSSSKYSANITFKCSPGAVETEPRLLQKSSDGCHYNLVWFTASACAIAHRSGENCQVDDPVAGFRFNLNPLSKSADQSSSYYRISSETTKHDYYINVCAPVLGTACTGENVGVCQVETDGERNFHSTGQANHTLHYYDGILKLVYEKGDAYHTDPPIARRTEILFLCDVGAGVGQPRFLSEANHTYSIEWRTSYACPPMFVDCEFTDFKASKRYDLSGLIRKDTDGNWVTAGDNPGQKFYINVCRPVVPLSLLNSNPCDASAGICSTESAAGQEKVKVANMGRSLRGPKLTSSGNLLLEYTNGDVCIRNNETEHYAVNVTFICNKNPSQTGPSKLSTEDGCSYSTLWETEYACPVNLSKEADGALCSISDPITGRIYDIRSLRSNTEYVVNATGRIIKVNVCGSASSCNDSKVSVCDDKGQPIAFSANSTLRLTNGMVELIYYGPETAIGKKKVTLEFICNELLDQNSPKISLVKEVAEGLLLSVETPLVCASSGVGCQALDKNGDKYNLSPLIKFEDNWFVEDPRKNKYYINICRPLNPVNNTQCPGGPIGGCQVTTTGEIFNMGYVGGQLTAPEPNTLTMEYENGDICHRGTPREARRSTRIIFYCSTRHEAPVFVREEDDCEYVIEWRTHFACPVQHVVGSNCVVQDPVYHGTFDLNELTKSGNEDYIVSAAGRNFSLNVCGSLRSHKDDNCAGTSGACIGWGSSAINIGNYNQRLEYENGELKLVYEDGKENCNRNRNRTTTFAFSCDRSKSGAAGLSYLESKSTDCSHWFDWHTSLACLPFQEVDCSFTDDKGYTFDFEPLTLDLDNYEVDAPDAPGGAAKFVINVCRTVIRTGGALCPPNSAACLIHTSETDPVKRYESAGQLSEKVFTFEDNHIALTYSGGKNCSNGQQSKTVISFACEPSAFNTKPQYITTESSCIHRFIWSTRAACAFNSSQPSSGNCSVQDPVNGHVYNLSALRNTVEPYVVLDSAFDHVYNLSVCGPLQNSSCGPDAGSCQTEKQDGRRSFSAGQFNSNVTFVQSGLLSMTYSNGTMCHHNSKPRTTTINFICASGAGKGEPKFVGEDPSGCNYIFSWHTDLACDREIRCVAHSENQDFDLSYLRRENGFYNVTSSGESSASRNSFYINICHPLGAIYGKFCPPGAAVCREDANGTLLSLGSVSGGPAYDPVTQNVVLIYSNGSRCSGESNMRWKTKITFICGRGQSELLPKLKNVDEKSCEYQFEWVTDLVCPVITSWDTSSSGRSSCVFNASAGQFNFSRLMTSSAGKIEVSSVVFPGHKYNISLCGGFNGGVCKSSPVCRVNGDNPVMSYGNTSDLTAVFESTVKLLNKNGMSCSTEHTESIFLMECNRAASKNSKPQLTLEGQCSVMFTWSTPFACLPELKPCSFQYRERTVDLSPFSLTAGAWTTSDPDGNSYFLNLCHGINDGPDGCGNDLAVCRQKKDGSVEPIGTVNSQSYSGTPSESQQALIIEYSNQLNTDKFCGARIVMVCNLENEQPRFKETVNGCIVEFEWKMSMVCDHSGSTPGVSKGVSDSPAAKKSEEPKTTGTKAVAITVCVLLLVLCATVVLVVFRNPARRSFVAAKVKSCVSFRKSASSSVQYSMLSDRELNEGDGLLSRGSGNIQHYDSDDDILL